MAVPLIDFSGDHAEMLPRFKDTFEELVKSGQFVLGKYVQAFEQQLGDYVGSETVGVSSGTDALLIALMALEIGPGDEVILPAFTFFATAGCVARTGAKPVFVDVDPATYNIDPQLAEAAITPNTKAIMPVHLFGQPADMVKLLTIAAQHNIAVIEDAAQSMGSSVTMADGQEVRCGSIGHVGCHSFYPTKNLAGLGDGGACTTTDADLAERLRQLRNHGQTGVYEHAHIGGNFRLNAIQAAMLSIKLEQLEVWNRLRFNHAQRYHHELADLSIGLPLAADGVYHVYNQYTVRVPNGRRDLLSDFLSERQIGNRVYYPMALHLQPCFKSLGYQEGDLPHAEQACKEVLSIPVYPAMTRGQQDEVIAALKEFDAVE